MAVSCREKEQPFVSRNVDLTVTVSDGNSLPPIPLAEVTIDYEHHLTGQDGTCLFEKLIFGRHTITVKARDYQDYTDSFVVGEGMTSLPVKLTTLPPYLEVDFESISTLSLKGTKEIQIRSNSDWKVVSDSPEISFNKTSGHGSGTFIAYWSFQPDSTGLDYKEAFFSVRNAYDTLDFGVRVAMPIFITSVEGISNNFVKDPNGKDSCIVRFSRKVRDVKVFIPEEREVYWLDDYSVSFAIPAAMLCRAYPVNRIIASSANGDGSELRAEDVKIPFYDKLVIFDGVNAGLYLYPDRNTLWMATIGPDKLRKIDTKSFEVLKEINLDFHPGPLALNPHNGMLYVIDNHLVTDETPEVAKTIRVVDPNTGRVIKRITIEPDEEDIRHNYTSISPYKVVFAENGMGAVLVSRDRIRLIDSRDGDRVIKHQYLERDFEPDFEDTEHHIRDIMLDNAGTGFLALILNSYSFFNLDSDGVNGSHFKLPNPPGDPEEEYGFHGHLWIYKQHREKPLFYLVTPYSEALYDRSSNAYTDPFIRLPGWNSVGDFCYGTPFGDDVCTFLFNRNGFFLVLDHTTKEIKYDCDIPSTSTYVEDFISFYEGDRVIVYENMVDKTYFTVLNTSRFWNKD